MFVIHGKSSLRIKTYTDNQHACPTCGTFDLAVKVSADYHHIFFVPIAPGGTKNAEIFCKHCGQQIARYDLEKHYEHKTRNPFYLYAVPLLIAGLITMAIFLSMNAQDNKAKLVAHPQVGDVYTVRSGQGEAARYYFLRLVSIEGEVLTMYHSSLEYTGYPSDWDRTDFFVKDQPLFYTKKELQESLDRDEINDVQRNAGKRFERIN